MSGPSPLQLGKRHGAGDVDALPAGLDLGQRLHPLHGTRAALRELLIKEHVVPLPLQLLGRELPQDARRNARGERAWRNPRLGPDEGHRRDHRVLANLGVVVHDAVHADERAAPYDAAVEHRAVAHGGLRTDDCVLAGEAVQHAGVLDVRAFLDHDAAEITAQAGAGSDISPRTDNDIAEEHRALVNEWAGVPAWGDA